MKGCEFMDINVEKIKDSIDKAAVYTIKKTGEIMNLAKLKIRKSELKGKIADVYKEIGEMVYIASKNEDDITERLNFLVNQIDEYNEELAECDEAVAELQK